MDTNPNDNESVTTENNNNGSPIPVGFWIICAVITIAFGYMLFSKEPAGASKNITSKTETPTAPPVQESKEDYIKSTSKIGRKGEAIYYKDFLKAPDRYNGQRLNITGKILEIFEKDGNSVIQIIITGKYDSVIASYSGSIDVYKDDWITIYGEGAGAIDGQNKMGATISWPAMKASYIVKRKGPPS